VENPRRVGSPGTDKPSFPTGDTPEGGGEGHSEARASKPMGGGGVDRIVRKDMKVSGWRKSSVEGATTAGGRKTLEGRNPRKVPGSGRSKPPAGATDSSGGARP
jgi:hypothetical protein